MLILLLIGGGVYWIWSIPQYKLAIAKKVFSNTTSDGALPAQLGDGFDPTLNTPRFMVKGVGRGENTLQLEYAFPTARAGVKVESKIVCEKGISVKYRGQTSGSKVTGAEALGLVNPVLEPIFVGGLCSDNNCQTIVGECDMYLSGSMPQ